MWPRELCGHLFTGGWLWFCGPNSGIAPWLLRPMGALARRCVCVCDSWAIRPGFACCFSPCCFQGLAIVAQQPRHARAPGLCVLSISLGEGGFLLLRSAKSSQALAP